MINFKEKCKSSWRHNRRCSNARKPNPPI